MQNILMIWIDGVASLVLLALTFISMGLYSVRLYKSDLIRSAFINSTKGNSVFKRWLFEGVYWNLHHVGRFLCKTNISPDAISWLSFLFAAFSGFLFAV